MNTSKRRLNNTTGDRDEPQPVTLFRPSIYGYTCRGAFFVSSENNGSEGTCRGFQSRLELLADLDSNTREGAIKDFTYMTDYDMDDSDANTLNQQTKSILVSPALIYKNPTSMGGSATPTTRVQQQQQQQHLLPEEEIIKRQEWSCFGSTEVEYLVLKDPMGVERITAVAPRNSGISVRRIESDDGTITSMAIGWLNIVVDSGPMTEETSNHEDDQDRRFGGGTDHVPPKPPTDSIAAGKESLSRAMTFSIKVAEHMKANVMWLYGTMQDDFAARTLTSGKKIVSSIPKTVDRTAQYMTKMVNYLTGGGGRDDGQDR